MTEDQDLDLDLYVDVSVDMDVISPDGRPGTGETVSGKWEEGEGEGARGRTVGGTAGWCPRRPRGGAPPTGSVTFSASTAEEERWCTNHRTIPESRATRHVCRTRPTASNSAVGGTPRRDSSPEIADDKDDVPPISYEKENYTLYA